MAPKLIERNKRSLIPLVLIILSFFTSDICKAQKTQYYPVQSVECNDNSTLTDKDIQLGKALVKAFLQANVPMIKELVSLGAPVRYRLNYGLPIYDDAHFLMAFYLLLEGDKGIDVLNKNANIIFGKKGNFIASYLANAPVIFNTITHKNSNKVEVPVRQEFKDSIIKHAAIARAAPENANGAIHVAAGLQDHQFLKKIIKIGKKKTNIPILKNGSKVGFRGYLNDTASLWSALFLDEKALEIFLNEGCAKDNIGTMNVSILHWAIVASQIRHGSYDNIKGSNVITFLLERGVDPEAKNILGKRPIDYAKNVKVRAILKAYERR
jgi:hypothetical protein